MVLTLNTVFVTQWPAQTAAEWSLYRYLESHKAGASALWGRRIASFLARVGSLIDVLSSLDSPFGERAYIAVADRVLLAFSVSMHITVFCQKTRRTSLCRRMRHQ